MIFIAVGSRNLNFTFVVVSFSGEFAVLYSQYKSFINRSTARNTFYGAV